MQQVITGDSNALEALYRKYHYKVFSTILGIVRNEEDAEELTQDVFLSVWQKAAQYSSLKGTLAQWLHVVARNKAYNHLRFSATRERELEDTYSEEEFAGLYCNHTVTTQTALDGVIEDETSQQVRQLVSKLPAVQRLVIIGTYLNGYSQHEISDQYNIPIGTVKTWARKGLSILRSLTQAEPLMASEIAGVGGLQFPLNHN